MGDRDRRPETHTLSKSSFAAELLSSAFVTDSTREVPNVEQVAKDKVELQRHFVSEIRELDQRANDAPLPPPDGGYGWVCTICVAIINAHTWGLIMSYGVFLTHYKANETFPAATSIDFAFVSSLASSGAYAISPLVTICVREFGTRLTMAGGIILQTVSLVAGSFTHQVWHLYVIHGLLFGLGLGFLVNPSAAVVPQWFSSHRSLANALAVCGAGVGCLLYTFVLVVMLREVGVEWSFRILALVTCVVNSACTLLIRDRNADIESSQIAFDTSLCRRLEFQMLLAFSWFSVVGYTVLMSALGNFAEEIGLSNLQNTIIMVTYTSGQLLGRPIVGYVSDRAGRINMAALMTLLASILSVLVLINTMSFTTHIMFAVIFGCVGCTFWTAIGPVAAEVVGLKHVPSAFSLIWLTVTPPSLFSEPIAIKLIQASSRHLGVLLFASFSYLVASACLAVLRGWRIGQVSELSRLLHRKPEHIDSFVIESNGESNRVSQVAARKKMLANIWKPWKV